MCQILVMYITKLCRQSSWYQSKSPRTQSYRRMDFVPIRSCLILEKIINNHFNQFQSKTASILILTVKIIRTLNLFSNCHANCLCYSILTWSIITTNMVTITVPLLKNHLTHFRLNVRSILCTVRIQGCQNLKNR